MIRLLKALLVQFFWPVVVVICLAIGLFAYGYLIGNLDPIPGLLSITTGVAVLILFVLFCYRIQIWDFDKEAPMRLRKRRRFKRTRKNK